jgi:endonuclease YncB( thermonuclease family)
VLQHLQATAAPDQTRPILDSAAEKGSVIIGIASIIDGDTIEIHGHRIRLFGVDAPESRQLCSLHGRKYRCGQKAAFALSDFLGQHTVSCKQKDTDRYGRAVAICSVDRQDVGAWMVSRGFALAFRRYSLIYVPAEESAAAAKAVGRCSGLSMGSWRKTDPIDGTNSDLWTIHIRAPAGLLSPVLPRVLLCEVPMPVRPMAMQFLTCVQTGPFRAG